MLQAIYILPAFVIAIMVASFFAIGYRKSGAALAPLVLFFFILFLAGIAGQYWIRPFGPVIRGISFGPLLFMVLLITLLFAAPSPYRSYKTKFAGHNLTETHSSVASEAVGMVVWLLLIVVFIAVLAGMYNKPHLPTKGPDMATVHAVN